MIWSDYYCHCCDNKWFIPYSFLMFPLITGFAQILGFQFPGNSKDFSRTQAPNSRTFLCTYFYKVANILVNFGLNFNTKFYIQKSYDDSSFLTNINILTLCRFIKYPFYFPFHMIFYLLILFICLLYFIFSRTFPVLENRFSFFRVFKDCENPVSIASKI